MKRFLMTVLLSFLYGIGASFVWQYVMFAAAGESHPVIVDMLYFSVVPIAAVAGFLAGTIRGGDLKLFPVMMGWVLSAVTTGWILTTSLICSYWSFINPATGEVVFLSLLLELLALYFIAGVGGSAFGARRRVRTAGAS